MFCLGPARIAQGAYIDAKMNSDDLAAEAALANDDAGLDDALDAGLY